MKYFLLCVGCLVASGAACSSDGNTQPTADAPSTPTADAPEIDAPLGPPNTRIVGTWDLMTPGSTCNISFADGFTATAVAGSDYNFKLALNDGSAMPPVLGCALGVADPTKFTCSNFSQAGVIPPSCNVSLSISAVAGDVVGTAVEIRATVTVQSPNCGQALNCGPLPHVANGTIE